MNNKNLKNLLYILISIALLMVASITLVSTGVITFEKPENTSNEITVKLTVENGINISSYQIKTDNATAFEVLEKARKETSLTFEADYYEEYQSHIINSINGIDSTENKYWIFYLNGEMAPVGADNQYVEDGDSITFKLEESSW